MMLGGGRGRFDINRPHGSVYYSVDKFSLWMLRLTLLTDSSSEKASYMRQRFGSLARRAAQTLPEIYKGGSKTFSLRTTTTRAAILL